MLLLLLFLVLTFSGCATYHSKPLDKSAVDQALATPATATVALQVSQIHHPLLRPVKFDLRDGLSPDEAAILAVLANPKLRAVRDEKGLAQAQLLQAGILPNPQSTYSLDIPMAGATQGTTKAYALGLNYDIVSLITRGAKVDAAVNHVGAVDLDVAWQEWQMAQAARLHVYRLALLDQQLAVAREEEKGLQENVDTVKRALDQGYVTIINFTAAQASLEKVHLQVQTIEQQREQERLALNQSLGLPPGQRLPLQANLEPPSPRTLPSLQDLSQNLEERRLDLLALKMGYQSQEEKLRAAILAQVPKINIGFSHASDTTHVITTGFAVAIDLPIFDRNQGNIAIEKATRQKLYDEYVSRVFTARADVAKLLANMASLGQQIKTTENSIPTLSNLVQTYYHALLEGNADVISYYNARDELIARQIELLTLKQNLADQRISLEIAAGEYLGSGEVRRSAK